MPDNAHIKWQDIFFIRDEYFVDFPADTLRLMQILNFIESTPKGQEIFAEIQEISDEKNELSINVEWFDKPLASSNSGRSVLTITNIETGAETAFYSPLNFYFPELEDIFFLDKAQGKLTRLSDFELGVHEILHVAAGDGALLSLDTRDSMMEEEIVTDITRKFLNAYCLDVSARLDYQRYTSKESTVHFIEEYGPEAVWQTLQEEEPGVYHSLAFTRAMVELDSKLNAMGEALPIEDNATRCPITEIHVKVGEAVTEEVLEALNIPLSHEGHFTGVSVGSPEFFELLSDVATSQSTTPEMKNDIYNRMVNLSREELPSPFPAGDPGGSGKQGAKSL